MRVDELFDLESEPKIDCSEWINQQLVMFDNEGITLKEVIATIVNTEGAHSVSGGRLKPKKGESQKKFIRRQKINILDNITFGNLKYNYIVVVETALYVYEMIMQHRVDEGEIKGYDMPVICIVSKPTTAPVNTPIPIGFEGGLILSLGGQERSISHKIRATK